MSLFGDIFDHNDTINTVDTQIIDNKKAIVQLVCNGTFLYKHFEHVISNMKSCRIDAFYLGLIFESFLGNISPYDGAYVQIENGI